MGQRLSANLFRVGRLRSWNSVWYSNLEYTYLVSFDYRIRDFVDSVFYNLKWPISELKIKRFLSRTVVLELLIHVPDDKFFSYLHFGNASDDISDVLFRFNIFTSDYNYISNMLYNNVMSKSIFLLLLKEIRHYFHYDKTLFRRLYQNLFYIRDVVYTKLITLPKYTRTSSILLYLNKSPALARYIPRFTRRLCSRARIRFLRRKRLLSIPNIFNIPVFVPSSKLYLVGIKKRFSYVKAIRRLFARSIFKRKFLPYVRRSYLRFKKYKKYDPFTIFSRYIRNDIFTRLNHRLAHTIAKQGNLGNLGVRALFSKRTNSHYRYLFLPYRRSIRGLQFKKVKKYNRVKVNMFWKKRFNIFRYHIFHNQFIFFKFRKRLYKSLFAAVKNLRKKHILKNTSCSVFNLRGNGIISKKKGSVVLRGLRDPKVGGAQLGNTGNFIKSNVLYSGDSAAYYRKVKFSTLRKQTFLQIVQRLNIMSKRNLASLFVRLSNFPIHNVISRARFKLIPIFFIRNLLSKRLHNYLRIIMNTRPNSMQKISRLKVRRLCKHFHTIRLRKKKCHIAYIRGAAHISYTGIQFFSFFDELWYLNSSASYWYKINGILKVIRANTFNHFYSVTRNIHYFLLLGKFTDLFNSFKFENSVYVSIKFLRYFKKLMLNSKNIIPLHGKLNRSNRKATNVISLDECLQFTLTCKKLILFLMFMFSYVNKRFEYAQIFLRNLLALVSSTFSGHIVSVEYQVRICVYLFIYYFFNHLKLSFIVVRIIRLLYIFRIVKKIIQHSDSVKLKELHIGRYSSVTAEGYLQNGRRLVVLASMLVVSSVRFRSSLKQVGNNAMLMSNETVSRKRGYSFDNNYIHIQSLCFIQISLLTVLMNRVLFNVRINNLIDKQTFSHLNYLFYNLPHYNTRTFSDQAIATGKFWDKTFKVYYYKSAPSFVLSNQLRELLVRRKPYFFRYLVDTLIYYLDRLRRDVAPLQLVSLLNKTIEYEISKYLFSNVVFLPIYYLGKMVPLAQAKMICLFVSYGLERGIPYFFVLKQIGFIVNFHKRRLTYYYIRDRNVRTAMGIFNTGIVGLDKYLYTIMRREFRQYRLNIYSVSLLRYSLFRAYNALAIHRGFSKNLGMRITCSGRMHRRQTRSHTVWFIRGANPLRIFDNYIDYYSSFAVTALGVLGIKTWIYLIQFKFLVH